MNLLIAEDDPVNARTLEHILQGAGHRVVVTYDGVQALKAIEREKFKALVTDWMMPNVNGIELTRKARASVPIIVFATSLDSDAARQYALDTGADDYLVKPYQRQDLLACLENCRARLAQSLPARPQMLIRGPSVAPPFVCLCIAASTGGPTVLTELLESLPAPFPAAIVIVQHGPAWMLESFARRLSEKTDFDVKPTSHETLPEPGKVYIAAGDHHTIFDIDTLRFQVLDEPPENFVRPAADPLFRSAALAFGRYCIAVVMTGLGRDGGLGAQYISGAGGHIVIQDPDSAVAKTMPRTALNLGIQADVLMPELIPRALYRLATKLAEGLAVRV